MKRRLGAMEKILITGGRGGMGKYLCRKASKEFEVHVIGKEDTTNIKSVNVHISDIRDLRKIREMIHQIRPVYVIHLAATSDAPDTLEHIKDCFEVNVGGFINLLSALEG